MSFEPNQTDEILEKSSPRTKDFESQLMGGCSAFVVTSLLLFGISVAPFLVIADIATFKNLLTALGVAGVLVAPLGALATRKAAIPGASGTMAAALATAIFLLLRMQQVGMTRLVPDLIPPEWPPALEWLVPLIWVVAMFAVVLVFLKREHFSSHENQGKP
jgi:hypothetical protein